MRRAVWVLAISAVAVAGCNTTTRMNVPVVAGTQLLQIDEMTPRHPTLVLSRIVADIRRGTPVAHFPADGVPGTEGTLCNHRHSGNSTLDWASGSSELGNWSTELGEVFHDVLSAKGLNIAGDPADLFGRRDSVAAAEYLIGARIKEIRGNFCHSHHWWDGRPLREYSGEMYIAVEWTIFSGLLQREVLKTVTQGYFKQVESKRDGIVRTFHQAFAAASENLLASREFVDLAMGKSAVKTAPNQAPARYFDARDESMKDLTGRLSEVLPSVVTVRLGNSHGSGFVISEDGLLLTDQHVVGDAARVGVILSNGVEVQGDVIARSKVRDVAMVRIPLRVPGFLPLRRTLPKVLDRIFVVGTPMQEGLHSTVTSGVVSAIRHDKRSGLTFIQSDAAVSPGNSGGPLLDANGNVIGISVLKIIETGAEGLNLFIPIGDALKALNLTPRPASS